ncbi:MAG: class I SAM-dependent methyltransferase [Caldilineales bacterium]|nr:class I SAM-dependent methyltransferase [Caldilineales bacterium]MDW8316950.1 class I SAM-dependent methyltransferase [Anaerolineae bacterium]
MDWQRYLTDYNEGLGLVYERFVLNDFLLGLRQRYGVTTVLEAPLFGMAGVSGINSVALAQVGCAVTLADDHPERLAGVQRIWSELGLPVRLVQVRDWGRLPFPDGAFDLAWEWAGLWHLADAQALLQELARVSRRVVFVAMPNPWQVGYLLRKHLLEPEFFQYVGPREGWTNMAVVRRVLRREGVEIVEEGVLDVPPWPDTVMPAGEVLARLGIRSTALQKQFSGDGWRWSTMAYYLGQQPDLYQRVMRYAWLDRAPLPWQVKAVWAHHRYLVGVKR